MHHSDAGGQHTLSRVTPHLPESGTDTSIGTADDALDNTLTEAMIGFRKTQLIKPRSPWHTIQEGDATTTEYVDWHNNRQPHRARGSKPPAEYETLYKLGDLISPVA